MVDYYIILTCNHLIDDHQITFTSRLVVFLPWLHVALLGDAERVEAAGRRWNGLKSRHSKTTGASTPPFNSTKTSIVRPTLLVSCISSKYVWFNIWFVPMFHQCLLTSFPPTIKQHLLEPVFFSTNPQGPTFQWLQLLLHHLQTGLTTRRSERQGRERPNGPTGRKESDLKLESSRSNERFNEIDDEPNQCFTTFFIHVPLYNVTDKCTSRLQCWVNLEKLFETCFKNLDMLDWLIGCFDSWQQLHHGTLPTASSWAPLCALMTSTAWTPGPGALRKRCWCHETMLLLYRDISNCNKTTLFAGRVFRANKWY